LFLFLLVTILSLLLWLYSCGSTDPIVQPKEIPTPVQPEPIEPISPPPPLTPEQRQLQKDDLYRHIVEPICEEQEDTVPGPVIRHFYDSKIEKDEDLDFGSIGDLSAYCYPYVYAHINLMLGTGMSGKCSHETRVRGKDCPWYHMCIWPPDKDKFISAAILQGAVWEFELIYLAQRVLMKYDKGIFLDVGANIGQYTLLAAAMGFKVFAFEPVPNHVEMIRRSLYLNGWPDRVHLYQNGIADYRDKVIINLHKDNQGGATIEKIASKEDETQTDFRFQARQTIDLVTFNDVLPEIDRYYPDLDIVFWKADIEGYEPRMFRGASNLLSQKKNPSDFD